MKNSIFLYILILSFSKMNLNTIFPSVPSKQEEKCKENTNPSLSSCTKIPASDSQYKCCYVTGVGLNKCGYLENTEYGIEKFENIYSDFEDVKIECKAYHMKNMFFIYFLFLFI